MDGIEQRIELLQRAADGRRLRNVGLVLIASVPIVVLGIGGLAAWLDSLFLGLLAMLYPVGAGLPGTVLAVLGFRRRQRALATLRDIEARQLPPARVV